MHCPSNSVVHILFVCEKEHALATFVALFSLKEHAMPDKCYHVHILTIGISFEQECALQALADAHVIIDVHSVDSEKESTSPKDVAGILTLQLANVFWDVDKALYLDAHTLITGDICPLYALDVSVVYAGLVYEIQNIEATALAHQGSVHAHIAHSKIMLLHLQHMREEKVVAALMACNVPKGDYVGYSRALQKILGAKSLPLPPEYIQHVQENDRHGAAACIVTWTPPHASQTGKLPNLWYRYADKARKAYADMYAAFEHSEP